MTAPTVAFFNHKGGVGKTSLVYHMAWMYADLGHTVVAVDLDPQANLTRRCLDDDRLAELGDGGTIDAAVSSLMRGGSDIQTPVAQRLAPRLYLIAGDLTLSSYEEVMSREWALRAERREQALRVTAAFWTAIQRTAEETAADVVLIDLAPGLGAINRAALIASDHVVIPVTPDQVTLHGLESLGATLRSWRDGWKECLAESTDPALSLPRGMMNPAGYVVLKPVVRLDRPVRSIDHWMAQIPRLYATAMLDGTTSATYPDNDPQCLGVLGRYGSLMQLSQEAHKPIFHLKASDGAVGSHAKAEADARREYEALARKIAAVSWGVA